LHIRCAAWAVPVALLALQAGSARPAKQEPSHLKAARVLVKEVKPKNNSYRHRDNVVTWKGSAGANFYQCHTDCSGLINALLKHSYRYKDRDLAKWLGVSRPRAEDYYRVINRGRGFVKVANLKDVRPGDILAVKYPPGAENTGHTMLVAAPPRLHRASKPLVNGTEQWEVEVIDSSRSGHGPTDTRRTEGGKSRQGIGHGVLRIYTHRSGAVAGYTWSVGGGSRFYAQKERSLVIGRLDPTFRP
jgi:hypothetical protein